MNRRELDKLKRRIETHQGRRTDTLATIAGTPFARRGTTASEGELALLRRMIVRRLGAAASREIVARIDAIQGVLQRINHDERALLMDLWHAVDDAQRGSESARLKCGDLLTQLGLKA